MDVDSESSACARALASYLRANPRACDTAEGIRCWWFDAENEVAMDELFAVLDWMKYQGLIEEVLAADGRRRYRRTASDEQLAALLAGRPQEK